MKRIIKVFVLISMLVSITSCTALAGLGALAFYGAAFSHMDTTPSDYEPHNSFCNPASMNEARRQACY